MSVISPNEAIFLGTVLEFWFYGVYCVVFALYLKMRNRGTGGPSRLQYPLAILFTLCSCYVCLDFASEFITIFRPTSEKGFIAAYGLSVANNALYAFIDVISQGVLIYRCWVMWNSNPLLVIIPSVLALTSFVLSMTLTLKYLVIGATGTFPPWWFKMALASFSISLCVNAVVTGLLVFKIILIYRSQNRVGPILQGTPQLRPLISIIVESGMFTLVAQTLWVVFVQLETKGNPGFGAIVGSTTMIYGITPTIVLVRSAMGRSYEKTTMMDSGTIKFKFDNEGETETSLTTASYPARATRGAMTGSGQSHPGFETECP